MKALSFFFVALNWWFLCSSNSNSSFPSSPKARPLALGEDGEELLELEEPSATHIHRITVTKLQNFASA